MVSGAPTTAAPPRPAVRGGSYRRAFRYLRMLAELGPGAHSLTEISDYLGEEHRSLVHQVLAAGVAESLVAWKQRGHYELLPLQSSEIAMPGRGRASDAVSLPAGVRPALAALHRSTGGLVVLHGLLTPGPRHLPLAAAPRTRRDLESLLDGHDLPGVLPLSQGAAGHAMLAHLDPAQAARVLDRQRAQPGGPFTEPLRVELARIRESGVAEARAGRWRTFAVPLLSHASAEGALSVALRADLARPAGAELSERLRTTADYLAQILQDPAPRPFS